LSLTIAEIMTKMPTVFVSADAEGMDAVVHFKFTGAEAGEWNAAIRDGSCQVAQGIPPSTPNISLAADSADFVQVVSGKLDPMKAYMDGKLKITGDMLLVPKLIRLFRVS